MKTRYINRIGQGYRETVDEFPVNNREERKEFNRSLNEYRFGDPSAIYYGSRRCCADWKR